MSPSTSPLAPRCVSDLQLLIRPSLRLSLTSLLLLPPQELLAGRRGATNGGKETVLESIMFLVCQKLEVGKCPNVSHHPTTADIMSIFEGDVKPIPKKGHLPTPGRWRFVRDV